MTISRSMNKQAGGTLLGIIIGALLGLGAALAVAVYVTKVPIPFLNRSQSHSAENDAAEAKKNRDWDPNAPLAGKNPARPSVAASGPVGDPATPPVAAASAPRSPASTARAAVSSDPLGDLAKARSAARPDPVAPAATGVDPFSYFIQAGAFRTPEDAEQQRAKLSLMGFQAKVTEREQSGRTVYRVRLGPFDKKDEADKTKEKLDSNAVETALVRVQR
ncbi:MAG: Sporulation related protein [Polaromonas sp.]|nr:Sporulation related protein [Polaromonas sp.]